MIIKTLYIGAIINKYIRMKFFLLSIAFLLSLSLSAQISTFGGIHNWQDNNSSIKIIVYKGVNKDSTLFINAIYRSVPLSYCHDNYTVFIKFDKEKVLDKNLLDK